MANIRLAHVPYRGTGPVTQDVLAEIGANQATKMPFFRVILTDVCLRSCSLTLATEGLRTENFDLEYDKVELATWWTENQTGGRLQSTPNRCEFDLAAAKQQPEEGGGGT